MFHFLESMLNLISMVLNKVLAKQINRATIMVGSLLKIRVNNKVSILQVILG